MKILTLLFGFLLTFGFVVSDLALKTKNKHSSPTNAPPLRNGITNNPTNAPTSSTPMPTIPTNAPTKFPTSPPTNVCDNAGINRISGGTDAPPGAYPYQISMRKSKTSTHFCGGSIISNRWILTAALCVIGSEPADIFIVAGTNLQNSGGTAYSVEQIVMHPAYNHIEDSNDYALVRVNSEIAFGPTVATIELATERAPAESIALVTGWGFTNSSQVQAPNNLQQICLRIFSDDRCSRGFPDITNPVCTVNLEAKGICRGDSGGPLVVGNRQVGIVSFAPRICAAGFRSFVHAYASVPEQFLWIQSITSISN